MVLPRHARTDAESDEVLSAKLPNILNVKRECFDEVSFLEDGEQDDDAVSGASYLRWRFKKDASNNRVRDERNQYVPESNARIVECWPTSEAEQAVSNDAHGP